MFFSASRVSLGSPLLRGALQSLIIREAFDRVAPRDATRLRVVWIEVVPVLRRPPDGQRRS
jgi:hypothetical protein